MVDIDLTTFLFSATNQGTPHLLSLQVRQGQMGLRGTLDVRCVCVYARALGRKISIHSHELTPSPLPGSAHNC